MIRIGLLGAGHLGKIHLKLLKEIPDFDVVGFYDPNPDTAAQVAHDFGVPAFATAEDLMDAADALDIVSPTRTHFDLAELGVKKQKHIFVEKPIATTPEEAKRLVALLKEAGVTGQVGHVERYNPALLAVKGQTHEPKFIEVHRLAQWNPRGTDVSVVLDLMIHDLDIVLHLVRSPVKRVAASGVAVVTDSPDIANARIEFHNGAVANLTASRISMKAMRKMRLFQPNEYIALDFLDKTVERFSIVDSPTPDTPGFSFELPNGRTRTLVPSQVEVPPVNAILAELTDFAHAIRTRTQPPVTFYDAYLALDLAHQILEKIQPGG
jgi:predicted dehydrogenase